MASRFELRLSEENKKRFSEAAKAEGLSLAQWFKKLADTQAPKNGKNPETMSVKEILDLPQEKFDKIISKKPFWSNPKK